MKYCDKCRVRVVGNHESCPLCQRRLSVQETEKEFYDVFPYVPTLASKYQMVFKILNFFCISLIILSISLNLMIFKGQWWSLFVIAGVVCLWVSSYTAVLKRKNISKNLLYQMVLISGIVVLWDYITGWKGWSLDFVIPVLFLVNLLVLFIISKVRKNDVDDYYVYPLIGGVYGIVPILFYLLDLLHYTAPTIICATVCILFLVGAAIFEGEKIREELKRRLHYK